MNYFGILTPYGKSEIARCLANETKINITKMGIGDGLGSEYEPQEGQTGLKRQWHTIDPLRDIKISGTHIVVEGILSEQQGGYWIREISLIDNTDRVIAIANHPATYKPIGASSSIIRLAIATEHTGVFNLHIDTSNALVTRDEFYVHASNMELHGSDINPTPDSIAKRTTNGRLRVGQPFLTDDAVRLTDLNSAVGGISNNNCPSVYSSIPILTHQSHGFVPLSINSRVYRIQSGATVGFSSISALAPVQPGDYRLGSILYFIGGTNSKIRVKMATGLHAGGDGKYTIKVLPRQVLALMLVDMEVVNNSVTPIFNMISGGEVTYDGYQEDNDDNIITPGTT